MDFGDEKAYLVFGIAVVGNDHLDLLDNVCEILEDEDALEQLKTTSDMKKIFAVKCGETVTIAADGPDEDAAIEELTKLCKDA